MKADKSEKFNTNEEPIYLGYKKLTFSSKLIKVIGKNDPVDCLNWNMNIQDMSNILENMDKVSFEEWYRVCYQYECAYKSTASNNKENYSVEINSAGFVKLHNEKRTIYFVQRKKSDIFLQLCDCCE